MQILVIESGVNGGAMHTVRFAQQAGVPVWVTFPRVDGVPDHGELPESRRGTWELLAFQAGYPRLRPAKRSDKWCALSLASSQPQVGCSHERILPV